MEEPQRRSYGVRACFHGPHSQPGHVLATFALDARHKADALVDQLSTCVLCKPGRAQPSRVGTCYGVVHSWREPGYIAAVLTAPEREAITGLASSRPPRQALAVPLPSKSADDDDTRRSHDAAVLHDYDALSGPGRRAAQHWPGVLRAAGYRRAVKIMARVLSRSLGFDAEVFQTAVHVSPIH
jgi:hypothetical protein